MAAPLKTDPLRQAELDALFCDLSSMRAVVVAVSGGPDSMALMGAVRLWKEKKQHGPELIVASVNHGLRPNATQEAEMVCHVAESFGLRAHILHWKGEKPETGIQAAARDERYRLLLDLCREERAEGLVTAHTQDDQAETVLMRLARGSGLSGLRGMEYSRKVGGILHVRPLLRIEKKRLIASCHAWGIDYVEDPSNDSARYTRVRWRKLLPSLAVEGMTSECLSRLASRMARADEALQTMAVTVFERSACFNPEKSQLILDALDLHQEPSEIIIRVYQIALMQFIPAERYLRLERLENCVDAFAQSLTQKQGLRRNLGGVLISLGENGRLVFQREPVRQARKSKIFVNQDVKNVADEDCALGKSKNNT